MRKTLIMFSIAIITSLYAENNINELNQIDDQRFKKIEQEILNNIQKNNSFTEEIITYGQIVNNEILKEREFLIKTYNKKINGEILTKEEQIKTEKLLKKYGMKTLDINEIKKRVNIIPISLMLAQAIIESNNGTSRLYKLSNNPFGIWTYNKDKGIKPLQSNGKHYIEKFNNLYEAVKRYAEVLNSGKYFYKFRELRTQYGIEKVEKLAEGLKYYSAERDKYVLKVKSKLKKIKNQIEINKN